MNPNPANLADRKYALTRLAPGDYLLPSNDARTLWRIAKYTDGPSSGLEGWTRGREVWGVWRWNAGRGTYVDTEDWNAWDMEEACHPTRAEAIDSALRMS
jgi:hypothetical protein